MKGFTSVRFPPRASCVSLCPRSPLLQTLCSHLDLESVHNVLDVGAGQGLSEAELLGKVDLVVELMKLLQKLLLGNRAVQYYTGRTKDMTSVL